MSDHVKHTPTPWVVMHSVFTDEVIHIGAPSANKVVTITSFGAISKGDNDLPTVAANAEFIVLAVNSHDALTARVAELEAENAMLQALCTSESASASYHAHDCKMAEAECARLQAENEMMRAALAPFADIGIGSNPDYEPMIRMDRKAIVSARAALTKPEA